MREDDSRNPHTFSTKLPRSSGGFHNYFIVFLRLYQVQTTTACTAALSLFSRIAHTENPCISSRLSAQLQELSNTFIGPFCLLYLLPLFSPYPLSLCFFTAHVFGKAGTNPAGYRHSHNSRGIRTFTLLLDILYRRLICFLDKLFLVLCQV